MTEKWTKGPWVAIRSNPNERADVWWIVSGAGNLETDIGSFSGGYPQERRSANANLAAAAPELYAALEAIAAHLERIGDSRKDAPFIDAANAALSKARGET